MNVTEWKDVDEEQILVWGLSIAGFIFNRIIRLQTFGMSAYAMSEKIRCLSIPPVKVYKIGKDVI